MKKFLTGTTALIALSASTAALAGGSHDVTSVTAPANTGGLTVMVGGKFNFQSVFLSQDENASLGQGDRNVFFRNDTQLNFTAAGSTENFDYGAVIEVEADSGADKNNINSSGGDGKFAYLYLENDSTGRFEAGSNVGASDTLEVDAAKVARGTGGIDGDWKYNVNVGGTLPITAVYIADPDLPTADEDTVAGRANKVTYYSPRFSGAQFGVSFTPDTGDRGTASSITGDATGNFENVFAGGINYESDIEGVGIMASAVGERGTNEPNAYGSATANPYVNDLTAYSLGLGFEFGGFSVAGNWANLGDSLATGASSNNDNSKYWSLGAGYENGPYGVSVTYLNSELGTGIAPVATNSGTNQLQNIVVGADYQMAPGLTPFVEASFFDLDSGSTTAALDNNGNVVLVGAEVAF